MVSNWHTLPRLYCPLFLKEGIEIVLSPEAGGHYLGTVLRFTTGSECRLFNSKEGEFSACVAQNDHKTLTLRIGILLRKPIVSHQKLELAFSPLRKERQHFLVEKAVELGVTCFKPVLTQRTVHRSLQERRLEKHIIESVEQCERIDMPHFDSLLSLPIFLSQWPKEKPLFFCKERSGAVSLAQSVINSPQEDACFLVGPEGGFTTQEVLLLESYPFIKPISLGYHVLRSETAAITALAFWNLYRKDFV